MVVNIKNVVLKFIGTGVGDKYQACVNIYDTYDNLIYKGKTYNGILSICLDEGSIYKLKAISCGDNLNAVFYVIDNQYVFAFKRGILDNNSNLRTITFLLTDANYADLPIEKGKMFFGENN